MMYPSNNDMKDNVNVDNNIQMRQTNTSPAVSNPSQPSSPSCSTLLVIDDTSNSEDSTINNTNNIPIKPMSSIATQISHIQIPTTLSPSVLDIANGTVEQQRRRNSSIAKLLGGHPLHNQQYEEINQQILDDQSAQNLTNNNDNGTDNGIQRTRSSITRTLLMNTGK
jgi:LAS superfamily LD-carboxypeptidase LdcB